MQLFTCLYTDTDFRDNWIPSDFSIQKLKIKLDFPDNRQLKTKDIQMVKKQTNKSSIFIKSLFLLSRSLEIISVEDERIYTNVIKDVGLSCRFSDLR